MDFTQPLNYTRHIPIAQENMQIEPYQSQPAEIEKYNPNIGKLPEVNKFFCTLCQTPTYYDTYEKLEHHRNRFHKLFSMRLREVQKEKNIGMMMKIKS